MPTWLRRGGGALLVLLLLSYAYAPVVTAGLTGGEYHTLVDVERLLHPPPGTALGARFAGLFEVHDFPRRPLAAVSLALSRLVQPGPIDSVSLVLLRLENLVLLALAALAFGAFVRRLLLSWTGSDQATAAGRASALLIALQPLHGAAVASVGARGDLLALALGGMGGALFLKGRQERRHALTLAAILFGLLAGFSSRIALALPALVAVAEFTSARRYRPAHVRLRTATTTLLVSGACVLLPPLLGELAGFPAPVERLRDGLGQQLAVALERLGALVLPINASASGALGFALAGAAVLLALHPAFLAARSAPRLWGWMLSGWAVMTCFSELLSTPVRVHPEDVTRAATLLPASVAASVGLAVAATAISGLRRALLPLCVGFAWALLAHQAGVAWNRSAWVVSTFQHDLAAARAGLGSDGARLLAVDPPRRSFGVDAVRGALPWMLDPLFVGGGTGPLGAVPGADVRVRAISSEGLSALAREPEFEVLRSTPWVLVWPQGPDPEGSDPGARAGAAARGGEAAAGGRRVLRLEPSATFPQRQRFFRAGQHVFEEPASTVGARALVATVPGATAASAPPRLGWVLAEQRAAGGVPPSGRAADGELAGAWVETEDGTRAVFDLCSSLPWLLAARVRSVFSVSGWGAIQEAALQDELPPVAFEGPRVEGADWVFTPRGAGGGHGAPDAGGWSLELLDLEHFEFERRSLVAVAGGGLRAPGAERVVSELRERGGGPVAWSLLRLVDGLAVGRLGGRRE